MSKREPEILLVGGLIWLTLLSSVIVRDFYANLFG